MKVKALHYYVAGLLLLSVIGCQNSDFPTPEGFELNHHSFTAESEEVNNRYIVLLNKNVPEFTQLKTKTGVSMQEATEAYYADIDHTVLHQDIQHTLDYSFLVFGYTAILEPDQVRVLEQSNRAFKVVKDELIYLAPQNTGLSNSASTSVNLSKTQITPWGIRRVNGGKNATGKVA